MTIAEGRLLVLGAGTMGAQIAQPAPLHGVEVDLREVVRNPRTSDETVDDAVAWCNRMQRKAVVIEREIDGFVVNRVIGAASREAFALLTGGFASFPDIDIAVKAGLNWPMGPFQ